MVGGWKNGFGNHRFPTFGHIYYITVSYLHLRKRKGNKPKWTTNHQVFDGSHLISKNYSTNLACSASCHVRSRFHLKIKHDEGFPWLLGFQFFGGKSLRLFFTKGDICICIWYDLPTRTLKTNRLCFISPPKKTPTNQCWPFHTITKVWYQNGVCYRGLKAKDITQSCPPLFSLTTR